MAEKFLNYAEKIKPEATKALQKRAYKIYLEGITAYTKGDNKTALKKFNSAQSLNPNLSFKKAIDRTSIKIKTLGE